MKEKMDTEKITGCLGATKIMKGSERDDEMEEDGKAEEGES